MNSLLCFNSSLSACDIDFMTRNYFWAMNSVLRLSYYYLISSMIWSRSCTSCLSLAPGFILTPFTLNLIYLRPVGESAWEFSDLQVTRNSFSFRRLLLLCRPLILPGDIKAPAPSLNDFISCCAWARLYLNLWASRSASFTLSRRNFSIDGFYLLSIYLYSFRSRYETSSPSYSSRRVLLHDHPLVSPKVGR